MRSKARELAASLSLVYCAAVWGSTFIMVKRLIDDVDPLSLVAIRFAMASVLLLPYLIAKRVAILASLKAGGVLGILMAGMYIPQTLGLGSTSAANSAFITGLFIVFVPIFQLAFFKVRPRAFKLAAIALATAGLFVLTGGIRQAKAGDLITLGTALAYALHVILGDRYAKARQDPVALCFTQFVVCSLAAFALALPLGMRVSLRPAPLGVLAFLAIFPTVSAFVIQLAAQRWTSPVKVAAIFSLEPVFAAIFAWTLGGEEFSARSALGGLMIVMGMLLAELPIGEARQAKSPDPRAGD